MRFAPLLLTVLQFSAIVESVRWEKRIRPKNVSVNFNDPFYKAPFKLCQPLRRLNPVEKMKAQAFAAAAFSRCGPSIVIRYEGKYHTPAYGKWVPVDFQAAKRVAVVCTAGFSCLLNKVDNRCYESSICRYINTSMKASVPKIIVSIISTSWCDVVFFHTAYVL